MGLLAVWSRVSSWGPSGHMEEAEKVHSSAFSIVWHSASLPHLSVLLTNLIAQIQLMCVK